MIKDFLKKQGTLLLFSLLFAIIFFMTFSLFNLNMKIFAVSVGLYGTILIFYLLFDFTNYRKEEKVTEENSRLKKELTEVRNQYLEDISETEDYFLMWVHQIKTPITASYLLLDDPDSSRQDVRDELISIENYTRLALNYIKVTHPDPDMDFKQVKLDDIIRPLIKKYRRQFIDKNLKLHYQTIDHEVLTDANLTSVLLEQILSNALKYTEEGSVSIYFIDDCLYIQDTGPGIPSQDLERIFKKGYSGYNGMLHQQSSGIGLYLVQLISKRLNHKIKFESKLGEGTRFGINFSHSYRSVSDL